MPRSVVSPLDPDSPWISQFVEVWRQRRLEVGDSPERLSRLVLAGGVVEALHAPGVRAYVAVLGDDVVGYAITTRNAASALLGGVPTVVTDLHVRPGDRESIGRALLLHIARQEERDGRPELACELPTTAKDANRIMARLGFTAVSTVRVAATAGLVRSLSGSGGLPGQVSVLHHRRLLRGRQSIGG